MTKSKKLQALANLLGEALEAVMGDYTAIAVACPDGGFTVSYHLGAMPAHATEYVDTLAELESEMRAFVNDLRKWTWVIWE